MPVSSAAPPILFAYPSLPHAARPGVALQASAPTTAALAGVDGGFRDPDPHAGPPPTFDITPLEKLKNPPPPLEAARAPEADADAGDRPEGEKPGRPAAGQAPDLYAAPVDQGGPTRLNLRH